MSRQNRLEVLEMSRALRTNGKYGHSPSFFLVWQKQTFIVNWEIHRNMSILDSYKFPVNLNWSRCIRVFPFPSHEWWRLRKSRIIIAKHPWDLEPLNFIEFYYETINLFCLRFLLLQSYFSKYVPINVSVETLDYDRQLGLCLLIRVSWPWMFVLLFRLSSECGNSWSTDL